MSGKVAKIDGAPNAVQDFLDSMRVRATETGYYDLVVRSPGDVFTLRPYEIGVRNLETQRPVLDEETGQPKMRLLSVEEQFSFWMEQVPYSMPETLSGCQEVVNRAVADLVGAGTRK